MTNNISSERVGLSEIALLPVFLILVVAASIANFLGWFFSNPWCVLGIPMLGFVIAVVWLV